MSKHPNIAPSGKKKPGRPAGSKTRADAPSRQKLAAAKGFAPPARAPRPSEIKPVPAVTAAEILPPVSARPDADLFGAIKSPAAPAAVESSESYIPESDPFAGNDAQPAPDAAGQPAGESAPPPEPEPAKPSPDDAEAQRPLVEIVINIAINGMASMVGAFWYPRPIGDGPGQCPYDERDRLITSCAKWFAAMSIALLTPGQQFAGECFNYALPRLHETMAWAKLKFMKRAKPAAPPKTAPENDSRIPKTEPAKPDVTQPPPGGVTIE